MDNSFVFYNEKRGVDRELPVAYCVCYLVVLRTKKSGGVAMEKKLENLRWRPRWISHLGCIKGCLEYLGVDVSDAWLFGATGHAFVINLHDVV